MAICINNGTTTLSTASGFYRIEASNMGLYSNTSLSLSSTRTINVTFANAGNCQGIVLSLLSSLSTIDKSVKVELLEGVTVRSSVTLTASQILNAANKLTVGVNIPFKITPYAVTTAGATWSFRMTQPAGSTGNWSLRTSDATNPFFATWCDNAVSFSSTDCLIVDETGTVTIDETATFRGVLGTGESARSTAAIICRSSSVTTANVCNLRWTAPAAAYTLTLDGWLVIGSHSGFQMGTSASPISAANKATIICKSTPTNGTAGNSGIGDPVLALGISTAVGGDATKGSVIFYGEVPTYQRTTLNGDAASGQANITTTDSTGWSNGDTVFVGRSTTQGAADTLTVRTISSIAGTAIQLSSNLTSLRKDTGSVIRYGGFGIEVKSDTTTNLLFYLRAPSNFVLSGCQFLDISWVLGATTRTSLDDSGNHSKFEVKDGINYFDTTANMFLQQISPDEAGMDFVRWSCLRSCPSNGFRQAASSSSGYSGTLTIDSTWLISPGQQTTWATNQKRPVFTNNQLTNFNGTPTTLSGISPTITGNTWWGNSSATSAAVQINIITDPTGISVTTNNYIDNCVTGMATISTAVVNNFKLSTWFLGSILANTVDIDFTGGETVNMVCQDFSVNTGISETHLPDINEGSQMAFVNYDLSSHDDRVYTPYGKLQRCGTGLTDTTVRTSPGYSLRFESINSTNVLIWQQLFPTGDLTNQTMTISCWVKINNAAYYAGTHTNPTLSVKYDDTTTSTAVGTNSTSWQRLAVTFTPATSFGQILIQVYGATDATTSNAYFYLDDMDCSFPAGTSLDLGTLDLWANALPVTPTIATVPSTGSVWDVLLSDITTPGSIGVFVKNIKTAINIFR